MLLQHRSTMKTHLVFVQFFTFVTLVWSATDAGDVDILNQFRKNLENPELLQWPESGDPCGPPSWKYVFCSNSRVTQIQVKNVGLKGPLPQNLNQLSKLENLGLQRNQFSGKLPTFNGLSKLKYAYLDYNNFDTIPADFFDGLGNLQVLALDNNNFNASTGWSFPQGLQDSAQLTNLSCMSCNLVGQLPDFLGKFSSLQNLRLSSNNLSGPIPASFKGLNLVNLWLNDQKGGGLTGTIDVLGDMLSLQSLWLHGNQFSGTIPESFGNLTSLKDLNLNGNQFVGLIPSGLASLPLDHLDLNNNMLMGPIPKFKANKYSYTSNAFCQSTEGLLCAPEVMALIDFLSGLNYPPGLVSSWSGNDPCKSWLGLICGPNSKVIAITLPSANLSGTLSPSVGSLDSLAQIKLQSNNISGQIPTNWTNLKSLTLLDLSSNNISPPLPNFSKSVKLSLEGNPLVNGHQSGTVPSSGSGSSSGNSSTPSKGSSSSPNHSSTEATKSKNSKRAILVAIVAPTVGVSIVLLLAIPISIYYRKKRKKETVQAPNSLVIHPRDPSDSDNMVKIVVANGSNSTATGSASGSINSSGIGESHVIEAGNLVISVQVLRNVTKNFSPEKEIGRGGFGVVYKGELDDGTQIAVKRMEAGVISNKALDEFQAEIAVLSKVRHRHLVSLLGYSVEGYERILVYEHMPQGALSKHLFHWKNLQLEPLSWKKRLNIALDVARGMEYLHNLAHKSFIHRDLKSSNILLGDDFRAKVSDFGLVKLAPDGERSVVTRLAGTFGYLAPEYAGKYS